MFAAHKSAAVSAGFAYTYIGTASSVANSSSYTFSGFTTAQAGLIVCMFTSRGSSSVSVSSMTIGGDAATTAGTGVSAIQNAATGHVVKSAGTHNVVVTLSGSRGATNPSSVVTVWLVTGYNSITPVGSATTGGASSGSSASVNLDLSAGGIALYGVVVSSNDPITTSWSGATSQVVEKFNDRTHDHAFIYPTTTQTAYAETVSWSVSYGRNLIGISFR